MINQIANDSAELISYVGFEVRLALKVIEALKDNDFNGVKTFAVAHNDAQINNVCSKLRSDIYGYVKKWFGNLPKLD